MRIPVLLSLVTLLAACQAGPGYRSGDGSSPAISRIVLNTEFDIRAGRATEYIQGGKPVTFAERAIYYPHCYLELRDVTKAPLTLQPDTFTVTRIHRDQFMAARQRTLVAFGGSDGGNPVMSTTHIYLHSDRQPEVWRLGCQMLASPYQARHVTLEEIQEELDGIMTLE